MVLVAVVVLCTLCNDVIHAAYLAIALLLFRRRDTLRWAGCTMSAHSAGGPHPTASQARALPGHTVCSAGAPIT